MNEVQFNEDDKDNYHFYVNSSYWTPDRPDLQSILAHECAHGIIKDRLGNLSESALSEEDDVFIKLMRQINQCLDVYGVECRLHSKGLRLEIAVDLVAATINNMAYLYAIFLETMSNGLANLFTWGDVVDGYDLSLIDHLEGASGNHIIEYDWYIRLSLICIWLEEIYNQNKKPLEKTNTTKSSIQQINIRLIKSCQLVLNQQLNYLESITPQEQKNENYLKALLEQMRRCIKSSDAVKQAANWCLERSQAFSSSENKKPHQFPRRSKPLCPLAKILALQSFRLNIEGINNEKSDEELDKHISQVYGLEGVKFKNINFDNIETGKTIEEAQLPDLFSHINDISWTRAFLHALDFVNQEQQESWQDWMGRVHTEISLGRESFQLALDFHLDSAESKFSRLADVSRVIQEWCKPYNQNIDAKPYNEIKEWLYNNKECSGSDDELDEKNKPLQKFDNEINKLLGIDNKPDEIKPEDLEDYLNDYSAYDLMSLSTLNNDNALYHNLLDRIRGEKIDRLREILQKHQDSLEADLRSLKEYLENYGKDKNKPDEGYYKKMKYLFNALSQYKENGNTEEVYMLTRGSTKNRVLKSDEKGQKTDSLILLGRYDTLNIEPARPMLRCKLPKPLTEGEVDKWPSFFVRRELAIPIRLRKKSWCSIPEEEVHVKDKGVFAALSIVLTLRSTRLDFLTRLLKVINRPNCGEKWVEFPQHLVELGGYFSENDVAFLSEGGGDILLIFLGKPDERLDHIFKIQNVMFQDFQVDRTELLLTPRCVEYAATATQKEPNEKSNQFRVSVHVRLKEDRTLSTANESFKEKFNKKLNDLHCINEKNKKNNPSSDNDYLYLYYTLTRTPGRMDYSMRVKVRRGTDDCKSSRSDYCEPIAIKRDEIYDILSLSFILDEQDIVERVQTNIGWVEACDRDMTHRSR